jgi:hypothetical protein
MKRLLMGTLFAAGVLLLVVTIEARSLPGADRAPLAQPATGPCATSTLRDLRGAYSFTASAWQDLSEINPALPKGYAPVTIVGAFSIGRGGELTGWAAVNTGGLRLSAEFVKSRVSAPHPDCSVPMSLSMKINEFGETITGPYDYMGVVGGGGPALEIDFMMLGMGPGAHVEMNHAKRISMRAE